MNDNLKVKRQRHSRRVSDAPKSFAEAVQAGTAEYVDLADVYPGDTMLVPFGVATVRGVGVGVPQQDKMTLYWHEDRPSMELPRSQGVWRLNRAAKPVMPKLHENPLKSEELAHWSLFLGSLPQDSYLASYLSGSAALLESMMRNDMGCDLVSQLRQERHEAHLQKVEAQAAAAEMETKLKCLKANVQATERRLAELQAKLTTWTQQAMSLAQDARHAFAQLNKAGV